MSDDKYARTESIETPSDKVGVYNVGDETTEEADAVPIKYRGTTNDKHDMVVLGQSQVLRRNFQFITMLGLSSTVMAAWEVLLPLATYVFTDGGPGLLFWGFIVVAIGQTFVYLSLSELASMSPTAGGQYHWVSELAPPRYQKVLSYMTGWLTAVGWQVYLAGTAFMAGTIIQGIIALNVQDYVWHQWHGTLLTIAVMAFCVVFNTFFANYLSQFEGGLLVLHILGFFAIILPLWTMAPHGDGKDVIFNFMNNGGWSSTGLSAMIGLSAPMGVFIGYDSSVHMSEELRDASRVMPKVIMWSACINFAMAFLMGVTLIFAVSDVDSILSTSTGQPFIQLFYNVTNSYAGTNAMVGMLIVLLAGCATSTVAACSRQIWSFSRDGGLPFSRFLSAVNKTWNIPLRAIILCIIITGLLSCINLGSSVALNAINSLGGVSVLTSYFISISCVIYRRIKGPELPPRPWSLGKWGLPINVVALLFITPIWFFAWWPLAQPVTAENMNWASVMFAGVTVIAVVFYFVKARRSYVAPVVKVRRE